MRMLIATLLCLSACAYGDVEIYTPPVEDASVPPNTGYTPGDVFESDAAAHAALQSGYQPGDLFDNACAGQDEDCTFHDCCFTYQCNSRLVCQ